MSQYVYGKNVIKQLLQQNHRIYEIILLDNLKNLEFEKLARDFKIPIKKMNRKAMDQLLKCDNHQGVAAKIDDFKTYSLEELIQAVPKKDLPLFIMLDGIEDPHNLGAILRSADCIGAHGVIISKHHSVKLNATVAKVSTGAIHSVKVAVVNNLSQAIQTLKKQGFWVCGADMDHSIDYRQAHYDTPLVLVVGSEGFGISPLVRKNCDFCVHLPMVGSVSSLNASVACAILLYAIYDQRHPLSSS